jgi:spiro-SPASM protein
MKDTEEHLETFWRYWKEKTDHIIVQKYDDYCGVLPPRKVTDLSPVRRFPCWHNKRDLNVLLDGTVPRCREDIHARYSLGNLFHESIDEVWDRGESLHREHVDGSYPDICEHCDEYYTFNF